MSLEEGIDMDLAPLVVVEGFLGDPGLERWQHLIECQSSRRKVISVRLGALSSVHDRCCELYYQIKGGRVDYGQDHACEMGHTRFGMEYAGAYPQWSEKHPVHFLGHSLGGLTAWHLQQMLERKFFAADTSSAWVRSLCTFSAPLRGTTTTYILGCCEGNPSCVKGWSVGGFLYRLSYFLAWLNCAYLHELMFDPSLGHWNLHTHPFLYMLYNLMMGVKFDGGRDNAAYDLTVEVAESYNKDAVTFPKTFYRSYAASMTESCKSMFCVPDPTRRPPFVALIASLMGYFAFQSLAYPSEDWRDNDGIVPVISQCHPGNCRPGFCRHKNFSYPSKDLPFFGPPRQGEWCVTHLKDASHFEVIRCPLPILPPSYRLLMEEYWMWVNQVDSLAASQKKKPRPFLSIPRASRCASSSPNSPFAFPRSPIACQ